MANATARIPVPQVKRAGAEQYEQARLAVQSILARDGAVQVVVKSDRVGDAEVSLPSELLTVVLDSLAHLAHGDAVSVVASPGEITTQQAADLLAVSRPYLVRLLDEGRIPCRKVGVRRRVRLEDVLAYKAGEEARRNAVLDELADEAERLGLYAKR